MKQKTKINTKYDILTPNGWENFEGIIFNHNVNKKSKKITLIDNKSVTATLDHKFFSNDKEVLVKNLKTNDKLEIKNGEEISIKNIEDIILVDTYEIINSDSHTILVNNIKSHQCDELAFLRPSLAREFWTSISMTLSTGGKCFVTSTPNHCDDMFAEIWNGANKVLDEFGNSRPDGLGVNGFKAITAGWNEHPDRDEKWAEEQREKIGEERFAREVLCEFVSFEETLINPFKLNELKGIEPIEKQGQVRWYAKPTIGNTYLVSLDPSLGTGGDPAAIQVFEARTNRQMAEWTHNKTTIENQVQLLKEITTYLVSITKNPTDIYWSVENNTIGEAILVAIRNVGEENIPGIFLSEPVKLGNARKFRKGFNTTGQNKLAACAKFKMLIEMDKMKIFSKKLISELRTFVALGNSYQAKVGETDDLVMAALLIVRMQEVLKNYIPDLDDIRSLESSENMIPLPFMMSINYN